MLTVVPPALPAPDPAAAHRAVYAHVAEGFERALRIEGLADDDRARLTRCLRHARASACRRPLEAVIR
jgi:hypothetical protein